MGDVQWVNSSSLIAQNPKVTAINSCIEIDLTGQIVSDSIGTRMYSGNSKKHFKPTANEFSWFFNGFQVLVDRLTFFVEQLFVQMVENQS